jgi:sialate O-acetylesterase
MKFLFLTGWMVLVLAGSALAEIKMPNVFGDHMVLQADKPVRLWGTASPNSTITVEFGGQTSEARAGADGKWSAVLKPMKANANGSKLKVSNGKDSLAFEDVVVGEVWLASGQSNMQWQLAQISSGTETAAAARQPGIRFFMAALVAEGAPQSNGPGNWSVCSPETAGKYSAVGYFFASKLHREVGVPVGIVQCAWGGKPVETFTSREALLSLPEGKDKMIGQEKAIANYDEAKANEQYAASLKVYEKQLQEWNALPKEKQKGKGPRKPGPPQSPGKVAGRPATIWNGMIQPLVGYACRGAIWYQGESNAGNAEEYGSLFTAMIRDWRKQWGDGFRFLWVQLANFRDPVVEAGSNQPWAIVQDHQRRCLALEKTGMAVINDIGEAKNIHPGNKKDVGERLARWALADDYGKDVVKSGPLYKSHQISGNKVIVSFDHTAKGLQSRDGKPLQRFEIKGKDGKWHWADAVIAGATVAISCKDVSEPVAARYAWASNPEGANLVNSEGLPASLFTTE